MQTTFTRGQIKQRAKERMKGHFGEAFALNSLPIIAGIIAYGLLLASIITLIIFANKFPNIFSTDNLTIGDLNTSYQNSQNSVDFRIGGQAFGGLFGAILNAGISVTSLRWLRQDQDQPLTHPFIKQFEGFSQFFLPFLALCLMTSLITGLAALALAIPGIIVGLAYAPIYLLYADDGAKYGVINMLGHSWRFMKGHKVDWFVFQLSFIPWYFGVILTGGLLNIYFLPYHNLAVAAFYESLRQENELKTATASDENTDSRL
ncbi:DUF975 family protein [Lapidilactobacillus luobeiensis]|uniref:DUF975 family protein n=1 Tax=Lapidilactobacillus luobeiensis TaxID=2950371 RepID=UPI0021C3F3DF|nr:DUF975 family protein [Lapidilactobacillus luobeiensis]